VTSTPEAVFQAGGSISWRSPRATLQEYVDGLRASGVGVVPGSGGTYWVSSPERIVRRLPTFCIEPPDAAEVDHALTTTNGLIASYVSEPADGQAANAWVYLCSDPDYSLRQRAPAMQRNVRRALRELTIAPLTVAELLAHGARAFCDTRWRARLDDGTSSGFRRYFEGLLDHPGRSFLGAWRNGELAAFLAIVRVDDWVEVGSFSMTEMLRYRPNDALMYALLSTSLGDRSCRVVSYGLSSIEPQTSAVGLHRFKLKVGFQPFPVHRAFVLHPLVRPLANRATLTAASLAVNGLLQLRPRHRRLKKLGGMLASMLGATSMMEPATATGSPSSSGGDLRRGPLCAT